MANPFLANPYAPIPGATLNNINPNQLMNIYSGMGTANSTPSMILPQTETLPNGGGTFNPAGGAKITPAPIFTGASGASTPAPAAPVAPVNPATAATSTSSFYDKYRDPKTGKVMTPEEYAIYLGNKVPKGNGEITNYAGDAMTNPNESAAELQKRATNLNNSRNDIATGTTDPYGVGNQSGIAYSPSELRAIEKAYAGVYDPTLNDVFARLKTKQDEDKAKADMAAAKEERVFATNEAIRQWKATTGTKSDGDGAAKKLFTQSQMNDGASNAGLSITAFDSLDDDIKNFYINTPMAMNDEDIKVPIYQNFAEDFASVLAGDLSADQLSADITGSTLPASVKHYFIEQIPAEPAKKEGYFSKIWGAITGK
jgi:hypothetical protein